MKMTKISKIIILSSIINIISVYFTGILANTQTLQHLKTYSGGMPLTWFEFYYPVDVKLSTMYVINNITLSNFKVDIGIFFINIIIISITILAIIWIIKSIKNIIIK
jgi:hypothetical protein